MNLFAAFCRPARPCAARRPKPDWVDAAPDSDPADDDTATADAGSWFDSSWLLRAGVRVIEHTNVAPVANDLPLGWWIEGPGAVSRPSSPPSR